MLRIVNLRDKHRVSREDLATRFGVTNHTITAIPRGKTPGHVTGRTFELRKGGRPRGRAWR